MCKTLEAFSAFRENLINKVQHSNGDESFQANVVYTWNGRTENEILEVTLCLTTFEYGQVRIEEGDILSTDTVHMDFNPDFQEYKYLDDGFLVIKGDSQKIGGIYEVKIIGV